VTNKGKDSNSSNREFIIIIAFRGIAWFNWLDLLSYTAKYFFSEKKHSVDDYRYVESRVFTNGSKCLSFSSGAIERKTEKSSCSVCEALFSVSKNKRDHRIGARRGRRLVRFVVEAFTHVRTCVKRTYRSARPRQSISRGIPDVRPECRDSRSAGTSSMVDHTSGGHLAVIVVDFAPLCRTRDAGRRLLCRSRYIPVSTRGRNQKVQREEKKKKDGSTRFALSTGLNWEEWNISKWTKWTSDYILATISWRLS